jgi:hypothetical protein
LLSAALRFWLLFQQPMWNLEGLRSLVASEATLPRKDVSLSRLYRPLMEGDVFSRDLSRHGAGVLENDNGFVSIAIISTALEALNCNWGLSAKSIFAC